MTGHVAATGAELKAVREAAGIRRWEIAVQLRVPEALVRRIEDGGQEKMPDRFIERYQQALDDLTRSKRETVLAAIGRAH